jgi:small subunit ribosomal protein S17
VLIGVVTSTKMHKTLTVLVERTFRHEKYGKYLRKQKKYHAHDEREEAGVGDIVEIAATRPLSRLKRWRLVRIVEAAPERGIDVAAIAEAAAADVGLAAQSSSALGGKPSVKHGGPNDPAKADEESGTLPGKKGSDA